MNETTFTLAIRGRQYRIDARPRDIVVCGQLKTAAGRLLPGLLDALQAELRSRGFPVATMAPDMLEKDGETLILTYSRPQAYAAATTLFAAHVAGTEAAQRLLAEASTVDRRYHLAQSVGIHLDSNTWLSEPIQLLTKKWEALCRDIWTDNDFDYRFKYLVGDVLIPTFNYARHRYRRQVKPAGQKDVAWLRARLAEVAAAVNALAA